MGIPLLQSRLMAKRGDVRHGFTTRDGGVSVGPRDSLHLALRPGDDPSDIVENWRRACAAIERVPEDLALLEQVHGDGVRTVEAPTGPLHTLGPADGAVTARSDVVLAVRTADCVPVLMAGPGGIGVAHAGWRGVVAGVVGRTVRELVALCGCAPGDLTVAIGPHAKVGAYEVGPDVVRALVGAGLERERVSAMGPGGREHADLEAAVRDQLAAVGVRQVEAVAACTLTDPRFFSHRRDGAETGRLAGLIARSGT